MMAIANYDPIVVPVFPKRNDVTRLAVAIDTSGSTAHMFNDMIRHTMVQLLDSLVASGRFKLIVWSFDHGIQRHSITEFSDRDYSDFEAKIDNIIKYGGGGSSYDESFYLVKALRFDPTAMVFITDSAMMAPEEPAAMLANTLKNYVILLHNAVHPKMYTIPFKSEVIPLLYLEK